MTETVRFGLVGKQDLKIGTGTFEVRLGDGRVVTLDEIQLEDFVSSLTVGSVLFVKATGIVGEDNSNLFWDDTNNRLGIGNAAPTVPLDVTGAILGSSTITAGTFLVGKIGGSSSSNNAPVLADVNLTDGGNVGAGEDDLQSVVLPASAFSANKKGVRITAWGTAAANANAKTVKLYFGGQLIFSYALTINVANDWRFDVLVFRTGSNTQKWSYVFVQSWSAGLASVYTDSGTAAQTDTAAITIKTTGTATTDNDIVSTGLLVEMVN